MVKSSFPFEIDPETKVSDIVRRDFRTASVFRQFGINYCCGGNWPLPVACKMNGVDPGELCDALNTAIRDHRLPPQTDFHSWEPAFLSDFIINVHHHYLRVTIPVTGAMLSDFVQEHAKKFDYLPELESQFKNLAHQLDASMDQEEQVIFPYIHQLTHLHKHREPYGALFIRTLRKPVESTLAGGISLINDVLTSIRTITNEYTTPENACVSHVAVIGRLRELDLDLEQHLYLEQSILYPRVEKLEKQLLQSPGDTLPAR